MAFNRQSTIRSNSRNRRPGQPLRFAGFALVGVVMLFAIGFGVVTHTVSNDYSACVVTDKDRTRDRDGNSDMRIYTENCGTFSVGDNWLKGVTNSADLYASIEIGETYDFEATGFRVGLFSMFPKIHVVEHVDSK